MISRIIEWCARNRFLVFTGVLLLTLAGIWSMGHVPLDALPDISDVQVIIHTNWEGQPPDIIEDQVTYPDCDQPVGRAAGESGARADHVRRLVCVCCFRRRHGSLLGAVAGGGVSATDQRTSAAECASGDRPGRDRCGLGL